MRTCRNGHPAVGTGRFCLECGAALGEICPNGHASEANDGRCDICGERIGEQPPAADAVAPAAAAASPSAGPGAPSPTDPAAPVEPAAMPPGFGRPGDAGSLGGVTTPANPTPPPGVPRFIAPSMTPHGSSPEAPTVAPTAWPSGSSYRASTSSSGTNMWRWIAIGLVIVMLTTIGTVLLIPADSNQTPEDLGSQTFGLDSTAPVGSSSTTTEAGATTTTGITLSEDSYGTPEHPVPFGTPIPMGDWQVEVVGYEPNQNIRAYNMLNKEPSPGSTQVRVKFEATFEGAGSGDAGEINIALTEPNGAIYAPLEVLVGGGADPMLLGDQALVASGTSTEGFLYYEMPSAASAGNVLGFAPDITYPDLPDGVGFFIVHAP